MPFSALEISVTALSSRSVGVSRSGAGRPRLIGGTLLTECLVPKGVERRLGGASAQCATPGDRFHSGNVALGSFCQTQLLSVFPNTSIWIRTARVHPRQHLIRIRHIMEYFTAGVR